MTQFTSEEDTPAEFDITYDEDENPQRDLTEFVVTRGDQRISICDLDEAEPSDDAIVARGRVVNKGLGLKVVTAPLVEWCIEYGSSPNLWVRSSKVWYKLQKPAREYVRIHELARRRYEICSRIYILATTYHQTDSTFASFTALLAGPYGDMQGYAEKDILLERDFILAQVKNLDHPQLNAVPFVRELKEKRPGSRKVSGGSRKHAGAASPAGLAPNTSGHWCPQAGMDESGETRLMKKAEKALATISKHKTAYPFREPVDPVSLGCADYFERIANPMDFGTIKANIERGNHYKTAVDIANDVRLVAANCREYNGHMHEFSIWATELEKKFENMMREAEKVERASMEKRLNGANAKKRRVSESTSGSSKVGTKNGLKGSRKISTTSSSVAPPTEVKAEEELKVEDKPCARNAPDQCVKMAQTGSKYCSDECGMTVARKRIDEMMKSGFDVAAFIRTNATKSFVQTRGI